jgi:hypothetical protein
MQQEFDPEKEIYLSESERLPLYSEESTESLLIKEKKNAFPEQKALDGNLSTQKLLTFLGFFLSIHFSIHFITDFLDYHPILDFISKGLVLVEASLPLAVSFFLNHLKRATLLRLIGIIVLIGYIFTILWS